MRSPFDVRPVLLVLLAVGAFTVAGCGQRGPLYMPEEQKAYNNDLRIDSRTPGTETDPAKRQSTTKQ